MGEQTGPQLEFVAPAGERFEPLRRSEELYRTLVESSQWLVWRCDARGRCTFLNPAWERTLGYPLEELLGRTLQSFQREGAKTPTGFVAQYEAVLLSKDGREVHVRFDAAPVLDGDGRVIGAQGTALDVTEARLVEAYRECGREILQILNERGGLRECIQRVLATLKSRSGFEAVGIRLQEGDDFPYFVQEGFPVSFIELENTLAQRLVTGGVCRAKDGRVCLECTCGLVITGAGHPLLTPGGSFWTNDSTPLLDLPPAEDPRLDPRNQCIHYGYVSVALVPIRSNGQIVGLIQLNDRRHDRFTLERVEVLEAVASQIGEALMRKQMEAALRESEGKLREQQERLRRMAFEAAASQERERRSIAVDLHDSIGQAIALARLKVSTLRDAASGVPRAALDEVAALLAQSAVDSRTLVFALSPPVLYDLGLSAALSWLVEDLEAKHGLHVVLEDAGVERSLDETTAVVVFRSVRELLMNVLKHAQSHEAALTLRQAGEDLEVVVADAGVGFDPEVMSGAANGGSFGLFSLREQISRIGGTVEIVSAKNEGTRARVRVPVKRAGPPGDR